MRYPGVKRADTPSGGPPGVSKCSYLATAEASFEADPSPTAFTARTS